jgi:hypothetical protein
LVHFINFDLIFISFSFQPDFRFKNNFTGFSIDNIVNGINILSTEAFLAINGLGKRIGLVNGCYGLAVCAHVTTADSTFSH